MPLATPVREAAPARTRRPSPATGAVVDLLRAHGVHGPGPDRHLSPEIEACVDLVRSGAVLAAAAATGARERAATPERASNSRLGWRLLADALAARGRPPGPARAPA